ncbi:amino acid ABC transporter ATP-binding protein [Raoultella planticola]|uniref:Amino acid ABC transporter ATP-binding protein n=1 Tax=Raoultella planticola TaxID=575 RepID=A0A443VF90_RAOPL|nr:amino acid ABC transporter ATP-binding protein [Raoultella planticola]RWT16101.1 amino acid ABC transporter ATP-binding protein [Raoultella planticola]
MQVNISPAISVRGLSKDYDGVEILRDISFDVPKGSTTCLLGPSGSGKSTLLRCLNWLEVPARGTITISGQPMGRIGEGPHAKYLTRKELMIARGRIGTVFQNFALWPHLTVLENVMEAPLYVHRRSRTEVERESFELLETVGLANKAGVYPHQLSGGQKQRVAIARALAIHPELLLFDEPTSALDPEMVNEVLSVMRGLAAKGLTMVVVTHEMDFARNVANEIIFLDEGKLVETGHPDRFFSNPRTERAQRFLTRLHG